MDLITSRLTLIQLESKDASRAAARKLSLLAAAAVSALFAWALLVAGTVALVAQLTKWPWSWVALMAGAAHLLVGIVCTRLLKSSQGIAFPVTSAEFKKDREWIENFQKARKSND